MSDPDYTSAVAFSEKAALKVGELILRQGRTRPLLRVYIEGGGCSGFQYGFNFEDVPGEDDFVIEREGAKLAHRPDELPVPDGLGDRLQGGPAGVPVRDQQPERLHHLRLRDVVLHLTAPRPPTVTDAPQWRWCRLQFVLSAATAPPVRGAVKTAYIINQADLSRVAPEKHSFEPSTTSSRMLQVQH